MSINNNLNGFRSGFCRNVKNLDNSGGITSVNNTGTGYTIGSLSGNTLNMKSLVAGTGITLSYNGLTEIEIDAAGSTLIQPWYLANNFVLVSPSHPNADTLGTNHVVNTIQQAINWCVTNCSPNEVCEILVNQDYDDATTVESISYTGTQSFNLWAASNCLGLSTITFVATGVSGAQSFNITAPNGRFQFGSITTAGSTNNTNWRLNFCDVTGTITDAIAGNEWIFYDSTMTNIDIPTLRYIDNCMINGTLSIANGYSLYATTFNDDVTVTAWNDNMQGFKNCMFNGTHTFNGSTLQTDANSYYSFFNNTWVNTPGTVTILEKVTGSGFGTVTSVNVSGGTTGASFTGGPITTSGTITMGGTIVAANGGTGFNTYTIGDILYADSTTTLAKLGTGTSGQLLQANGVGLGPSWVTPSSGLVTRWSGGTTGLLPNSLTSGDITVTGTLIAANGGTGFASYAVGDLLYANTTTTFAKLADIATGNALISGGVNTAPSWGKIGLTTHVSGILPEANGGTNQSTYATGDILYASAANTLSKLAAGTNGYVLTLAAGVPTWAAGSAGGVTTMAANTTATANSATITGGNTLALAVPSASYRGVHYGISTSILTGNVGLGPDVLTSLSSGTGVIAIGLSAGHTISTGNNSIYIGNSSIASAAGASREYVFGYATAGQGSNTFTIDINTIPVSTQVALHINTSTGQLTRPSSSMRYKNNMPLEPILTNPELLLKLTPRAYTFKNDIENNINGHPVSVKIGYFAEEVANITDNGYPVFNSLLDYLYEDDTDRPKQVFKEGYKAVHPKKVKCVEGFNYANLSVALLELVKKQQNTINDLLARVEILEKKL